MYTIFPHIRPAGIIILHSLQMQILLENTTFPLHKIVRIAGIIRGRALYEEIQYVQNETISDVNKYFSGFEMPVIYDAVLNLLGVKSILSL